MSSAGLHQRCLVRHGADAEVHRRLGVDATVLAQLDDIFIEVTGKTLLAGDDPLQSAASRAGSSTQSEDR